MLFMCFGVATTGRRGALIPLEPHLVWMSEEGFALSGFGRVQAAVGVRNDAQSWVCKID